MPEWIETIVLIVKAGGLYAIIIILLVALILIVKWLIKDLIPNMKTLIDIVNMLNENVTNYNNCIKDNYISIKKLCEDTKTHVNTSASVLSRRLERLEKQGKGE